jgi:SSS family solute:Na+ symporter
MAATTFAVDTPLAITGLVVREGKTYFWKYLTLFLGLSGNWLWISGVFYFMLATFFFAAYWR